MASGCDRCATPRLGGSGGRWGLLAAAAAAPATHDGRPLLDKCSRGARPWGGFFWHALCSWAPRAQVRAVRGGAPQEYGAPLRPRPPQRPGGRQHRLRGARGSTPSEGFPAPCVHSARTQRTHSRRDTRERHKGGKKKSGRRRPRARCSRSVSARLWADASEWRLFVFVSAGGVVVVVVVVGARRRSRA